MNKYLPGKSLRPRDIIIERRGALRWFHHLRDLFLTLMLWAFLVWLWQPALELLFWYLNLAVTENDRHVLAGLEDLRQVGGFYVLVILLLCGSLFLWARTQQWRFRGRDTRAASPAPQLSNEQIAGWFGVDPAARVNWTRLRSGNVYFDPDDMVITIRMRDTALEEDESFDHLYTSPVAELDVVPAPEDYYEDFRPQNHSTEKLPPDAGESSHGDAGSR